MSGWVLICADGSLHLEHGEPPTGETEQDASDAAEFMDEERDSSPWTCGPHTVTPCSPAPATPATSGGSDG